VIASTFSLVACDLARREWGVAVAWKFLAIGALSAWAELEVGAIATQSWIKASYGEQGLRLLADGASAPEALERLLERDEGREQRQVGIVDREGRTATYTGGGCLEWAGDRCGSAFAAQGNVLVSADTLTTLADTFEATGSAPLAEPLIAALAAAQAAGGDRRGQQAAAVRVVRRGAGYGAPTSSSICAWTTTPNRSRSLSGSTACTSGPSCKIHCACRRLVGGR
jgi:uncharacterized Ntn-hydrolase superfamily protein